MRRMVLLAFTGVVVSSLASGHADGRGFGGFRAGGFHYGGFGGYGGLGGYRGGFGGDAFGGYRDLGYSGYRSAGAYSGLGDRGFTGGYERSWTGPRGGSFNVEGRRGALADPFGGLAAGGRREVSATGPGGRTFSGYRQGGVAVGPHGRVVGGGSRVGVGAGPHRVGVEGSRIGLAGTRFPTDLGLSRYSSFNRTAFAHPTALWSHGYMANRANLVRSHFGYYHIFTPGWFINNPLAWYAAGWAAGYAWAAATWPLISSWCFIPAPPIYYDYGNTIVYVNNDVYVNGEDAGTAQAYAQQATTIADQGRQAKSTPQEAWKPLGVFALVQGDEKTSNNLFQLAVNKEGVLRGNYYDGLMDTTTPIYGSVDLKTQRAAWTIGKKNDRVFETGLYNLTKGETPVLVHFGTQRTQQWLLVRVEKPAVAN